MNTQHVGSDFEDFLRAEGLFEAVDAAATKRVVTLQTLNLMRRHHMTKSQLADRMHTSRTSVDRLLDASNGSVTLLTLEKAAQAVGKALKVELV